MGLSGGRSAREGVGERCRHELRVRRRGLMRTETGRRSMDQGEDKDSCLREPWCVVCL